VLVLALRPSAGHTLTTMAATHGIGVVEPPATTSMSRWARSARLVSQWERSLKWSESTGLPSSSRGRGARD